MRGGGMGLCGRCMVYLAIVGGYVCGVGGGWVCVPLLVLAVVVGGRAVCVGGSGCCVTVVTGRGCGAWGTGGTWWVVYVNVAL